MKPPLQPSKIATIYCSIIECTFSSNILHPPPVVTHSLFSVLLTDVLKQTLNFKSYLKKIQVIVEVFEKISRASERKMERLNSSLKQAIPKKKKKCFQLSF